VLNFYQQRPVFALKIHPKPQRPELQKIIDFINIQCKIINKWECNTNKSCFSQIENLHFHNIKFLKLHFVKNIKIAIFKKVTSDFKIALSQL
jgi:hypothetical protein